jgi:isopenicillin-N N-acyltransferase-like protein
MVRPAMPDLVIGGRRSRRQHVVRAASLAGALAVAAVIVAWFIYRRSVSYDAPGGAVPAQPVTAVRAAPGAPPVLRWGDAELAWLGGIPVLRASGSPHAIGAAHGRLLATQVGEAAAPLSGAIRDAVRATWFRAIRTEWRYRFLDDGQTEADRSMTAGIARGAAAGGVDVGYATLLRDQAALDVGVPSATTAEGEQRTLTRALTFVTPQGGPVPGRVWVGRSFALPGLGDGGDAAARTPLVSLIKPAAGIAWASVGWPGLAGVVTGINAEGIVVCVHPVRAGDIRPTRTARPIALLARDVLETSRDLDAAIKLIETTATLGAAAYVIVDGKTGRWAVVERTPGRAQAIRAPAELAVGDVLAAPAFANDPDNDRARRVLSSVDRTRLANRLLRTPPADLAAAAAVLRDRRTLDGAARPAGHRGVIEDPAAVHVVMIDPAALVIWVADGGPGARMRAIDLRHELRGEGDRATPPADIAADPEVDADRDTHLRAARAELRLARRALADRRVATADEHAARALARAPQLPEALELAALIARARGDTAAAKAAITTWLDVGADDPQVAEELRSLVNR